MSKKALIYIGGAVLALAVIAYFVHRAGKAAAAKAAAAANPGNQPAAVLQNEQQATMGAPVLQADPNLISTANTTI